MTLPSQNDRSGELGRLTRAETGKKGVDPAMIALGVLLAVGATVGVYALIKSNTKPGTTPSSELAANTPGATPTNPTTTPIAPSNTPGTTGTSGLAGAQPGALGTHPSTPATTPTDQPLAINQGSKPLAEAPATTPTGASTTGAANPAGAPAPVTSTVLSLIDAGDAAQSKGNLVAARASYSKALLDPTVSSQQAGMLRDKLTRISDDLTFSSKITPGDPMVEQYTVVSGDKLITIAKKLDLTSDWRLIQRVNGLKNPGALRIGQKLKIVRGPFNAVVHKGDYRLDLFAGSPDEPDQWTFVKSFKVGLGTDDGTPVGTFVVKGNSKLVNPTWVNPRNPAEKYAADDPKNPIGEYWMGLDGVGESAQYKGFGIHGTIDPASIGQQKSMGCVRLADEDVKLMYEVLTERISVVQIKP